MSSVSTLLLFVFQVLRPLCFLETNKDKVIAHYP